MTFVAVVALAAGSILFGSGQFGGSGSAILYFPESSGKRLVLEARKPAPQGSLEERSREIVAELLIGPRDRGRLPLFAADVRLRSVMLRGGTLYVDLSGNVLEPSPVAFSTAARAIRDSLDASVPGSGNLALSIDGVPALSR